MKGICEEECVAFVKSVFREVEAEAVEQITNVENTMLQMFLLSIHSFA